MAGSSYYSDRSILQKRGLLNHVETEKLNDTQIEKPDHVLQDVSCFGLDYTGFLADTDKQRWVSMRARLANHTVGQRGDTLSQSLPSTTASSTLRFERPLHAEPPMARSRRKKGSGAGMRSEASGHVLRRGCETR